MQMTTIVNKFPELLFVGFILIHLIIQIISLKEKAFLSQYNLASHKSAMLWLFVCLEIIARGDMRLDFRRMFGRNVLDLFSKNYFQNFRLNLIS